MGDELCDQLKTSEAEIKEQQRSRDTPLRQTSVTEPTEPMNSQHAKKAPKPRDATKDVSAKLGQWEETAWLLQHLQATGVSPKPGCVLEGSGPDVCKIGLHLQE